MRNNGTLWGVGLPKMVSVATQTPWSYLREAQQPHISDALLVNGSSASSREVEVEASEECGEKGSKGIGTAPDDLPATSSEEREDIRPAEEVDSVPGLVDQLSELQFASELSSDDPVSDKYDGEDDGSETDTTLDELRPYPDLPTSQLPWPAVLQYLRESESEASKYFSLESGGVNTSAVEASVEEEEAVNTAQRDRGALENGPVVERMSQDCDFCGQPATHWSVLLATTGAAGDVLPAEACCRQFKEYCVLVAACLRQLITDRVSAQPMRISVALKHKKDMKKRAEDRAYAMMKRRERWEERQRRKIAKNQTLQSSNFISLTKQTKTIQFSLVSPAVLNTGWMVAERQRGAGGRRGKSNRRRKKKEEKKLPSHVLNMLQKTVPPAQALEVMTYSDSNRPLCTVLPDHTGQYYYPSGSLALLVYTYIPGVFTYLMFNDTGGGAHDVLGYADELGKVSCCYPRPDSSLRLQVSECGDGVMYSVKGEVARRWNWGRDDAPEMKQTPFQPLSLSLNRHLLLQSTTRHQMTLSFSTTQHTVRITIPCKLKEAIESLHPVDSSESYTQYLTHLQSRLKYLLAALWSATRGRAELGPVGTTLRQGRPRSRSTGALNFSKHSSRLV